MDKIKAEHMRSSSAMPALDPVKLGTKSSLLPSAAAEATQHAAAVAAAARPAGSNSAAPKLTGHGLATGPSIDAQGKTGRHEAHMTNHMTDSQRSSASWCTQKNYHTHLSKCSALVTRAVGPQDLPYYCTQPQSELSSIQLHLRKQEGGQQPCTSLHAVAAAGALGRAHTVAAMDQTKLQEATGGGLQTVGSGGVVTAADLSDSTAWKKQRPGATFFEKLQASTGTGPTTVRHLHCIA